MVLVSGGVLPGAEIYQARLPPAPTTLLARSHILARTPTARAVIWSCGGKAHAWRLPSVANSGMSSPVRSLVRWPQQSDACDHLKHNGCVVQGRKASAPAQQRRGLAAKRRRGAALKAGGARTRQSVHTAAGELARAELGARAGSRWALLDTAAAEEHNREILLRKKVLHSIW